jgi:hypothetical protein
VPARALALNAAAGSAAGGASGVAAAAGRRDAAASTTPGSSTVLAADQPARGFCPQVAFAALITGCPSLPGSVLGLAPTGKSIFAGLLGLLLVWTGALVYRRFRLRAGQPAGSAPPRTS